MSNLALVAAPARARIPVKTVAVTAALLGVALLPSLLGDGYVLHVATLVAIMATLALSMNLMLRIGQISMAHGAFMAIGAYASGLLTTRTGLSPWLALVLATAGTGLVAAVLGRVILRIKGVFFVLLTYAFGQIVNLSLQEGTSFTGGNNGLQAIPKLPGFDAPGTFYILALATVVGAFFLVRAVFGSRVGDVLRAIGEDEEFSRSLGVDALRWRTAVFALSAAIAGFAGGLYAYHLNFLSPSTFALVLSVNLLVMNIVGGAGSAAGPIVGALFVVPLPELLRDTAQYELLAYGVVLLLCLVFFQQGIAGFVVARWKARTTHA